MKEPQPDYLTKITEFYCHWLNLWQAADEGATLYKPENFLTDQYADSRLHLITTLGNYTIVSATLTDGDDGGGHHLMAWFNDTDLEHLVQEFDTYVQSIFDGTHPDGDRWLNTP